MQRTLLIALILSASSVFAGDGQAGGIASPSASQTGAVDSSCRAVPGEINGLQQLIADFDQQLRQLEDELRQANAELKSLSEDLASAKEPDRHGKTSRLAAVQRKIDGLNSAIDNRLHAAVPARDRLRTLKSHRHC